MITKDLLKNEIDRVRDENLIALYHIIKIFELPLGTWITTSNVLNQKQLPTWHDFIDETYGCLKEDPIERSFQGEIDCINCCSK